MPTLMPVQVSMIVAMAANRAIGKDGRMPWHLPADLKHFKETTLGCPVIMGRKTFESILVALGKPLPGRQNIVITRDPGYATSAAIEPHAGKFGIATKPEAALAAALAASADKEPPAPTVFGQAVSAMPDQVFVIGGAEIYRTMLPLARRIIITEIKQSFDGDAFFPALDPHLWREASRRPQPKSGNPEVEFDFVEYVLN